MTVEKLTWSTRLFYCGYSQMRSGLIKKMLDYTVSNKNDRDKTELAELTPIEIDFSWEAALRSTNILTFVHSKDLSVREIFVLYGA